MSSEQGEKEKNHIQFLGGEINNTSLSDPSDLKSGVVYSNNTLQVSHNDWTQGPK